MTVNAYATPADLQAYLVADPPADASRLLARAQELIDDALTGAQYSSDADGNPTDSAVIAALTRATCQQVEYWILTGDEFGQLRKLKAYSIEGISVTQDADAADVDDICARSRATLRAARLLPGTVSAT